MKNNRIFATAAAALILAACAKAPEAERGGSGRVAIKFSASTQTLPVTRGTLTAPDASEFSLSILKDDNSVSESWDNILLYPADTKFPIGKYTATASYGDANVEDYDSPCFMATSRFEISTDKVTEVTLTAKLSNTAVSVSCTEAFKNYFTDYSTTLTKTSGLSSGEKFTIAPDETRTLFIAPDDFTVETVYTKPNGKQGRATVPCIGVTGCQWYDIVFDVNDGQVGSAEISVILNDEVITQDINIDIFETEGK